MNLTVPTPNLGGAASTHEPLKGSLIVVTTLTAKSAPAQPVRVTRSRSLLLLGLPLCGALLSLALMSDRAG